MRDRPPPVPASSVAVRHDGPCPIASALTILQDQWTLLILRDAFAGTERFGSWIGDLGIARNILADRLAALVAAGVLTRSRHPADRRIVRYRLTPLGAACAPILRALADWGSALAADPQPRAAERRRHPVRAVAPALAPLA